MPGLGAKPIIDILLGAASLAAIERHVAHLAFRDALRASPELAAEYIALKRGLAERFGSDRDGYTEAKAPFIRAVILGSLAPGSEPHHGVTGNTGPHGESST